MNSDECFGGLKQNFFLLWHDNYSKIKLRNMHYILETIGSFPRHYPLFYFKNIFKDSRLLGNGKIKLNLSHH
jgi:hypothetical protein